MTIDLKYLIPFALPFAILATLRGLVFCAGAEWNADIFAVAVIAFIGVGFGVISILAMRDDRITWPLHIGRRKQ